MPRSANVVVPLTVLVVESSAKGPEAELPDWIFAVNPGVSVVAVIDFSATALPASSTRPTPGFRPPKLAEL